MRKPRFDLASHGTSVRTEVIGGITTFATMAYIVVVNPAILAFAGIPVGPSTVATILVAGLGSVAMGLWANRPIAVAPYMGENAFIAFGLATLGITWQQRLGSVFVAGVLFALLTALRIRPWLARSISPSLKAAFAGGIGLFLVFVGLYECGIVASAAAGLPAASLLPAGTTDLAAPLQGPAVPVRLGDLREPRIWLALGGFVTMVALAARGVRGAILIGIVATATVGALLGYAEAPRGIVAWPFIGPYSLAPIALQLDVPGVLTLRFLPVLLTLFLMSFLDTLGTLVAVAQGGDLADEHGDLPEIEKPMAVDAFACMFAALVGSSTSGAYIESLTGIRDGARTGLAAVVTGLLFLACLFFLPLIEPLQTLRFAYAPALVAVGVLMAGSLRRIEFDDASEAAPAVATVGLMIFTYSIANGITAGLLLQPLVKLLAGRRAEITPGALVLAGLCAIYFVFGLPH